MIDANSWKIAQDHIEWCKSGGQSPCDVFKAITGQAVSWASWETATALIAAVEEERWKKTR